ncbi:MAG: hypothetical protein ACRD9Y_06810 [Blastocatellia bacterium]
MRKGRKTILKFERKSQPLLNRSAFLKRLMASVAMGTTLIVASLLGGMVGYHRFEGLSWIDSFANAAMILSGMGPLAQPATTSGKIFAGLYALYSGFAVLIITGITFAPIVHRFLHRLHAEEGGD